jgi:hypothetical protein
MGGIAKGQQAIVSFLSRCPYRIEAASKTRNLSRKGAKAAKKIPHPPLAKGERGGFPLRDVALMWFRTSLLAE